MEIKLQTNIIDSFDRSKEEAIFIKYFDKKFRAEIEQLFYKQKQLELGNRLRPRLVFWGYAMTDAMAIDESEILKVVDIAISVELIHKASIILDDYFDGDVARRGEKAFHVEYGANNTVLFASNMINRALMRLNSKHFYYDDINLYLESEKCLLEIVDNMSIGCLQELNMGKNHFDVGVTREIMHKETEVILANSILLGYYLGCANNNVYNNKVENLIRKFGNRGGYIFQMLNDLEPFSYNNKNYQYKGGYNTDFSKMRKNMVISILYGVCDETDQIVIKELVKRKNCDEKDIENIHLMLKKYEILGIVNKEITDAIDEIKKILKQFSYEGISSNWCIELGRHVQKLIEHYEQRLN